MDSLFALQPNRRAFPVCPAAQRVRFHLEAGRPVQVLDALLLLQVDRDDAGIETPRLLFQYPRRARPPFEFLTRFGVVPMDTDTTLIPRALRIDAGRIVGALIELQQMLPTCEVHHA